MRYVSDFFRIHSWDDFTLFEKKHKFFVCLSVCQWHTSSLKLDKCMDISCSGWYIFQKFLGDIAVMFLHYFKTNTNCLYVCQFVSWPTSLLKLGQYRDISCSEIFLEIFLGCLYTISKWLKISCLSVSQLVGLLTSWNYANIGISPVLDKIPYKNFFETFLDVYNFQKFLVCPSVC